MNYVEDKIVINAESEKGKWLIVRLLISLGLLMIVIVNRAEWFSDILGGVVTVVFWGFWIGYILLSTWLQYYTLIMDKNGCIKRLLFYKRKYTWDELIVKQVYTPYFYSFDCYKEGVFFSTKQNFGENDRYNISSYFWLHPFSCFLVNFKGTYSMPEDMKYSDMMRFCEIDKTFFMNKMDEWGITLTHLKTLGRSNKAELLGEQETLLELDQVIVQSDREAKRSAKFSFIAAVSGIVILTGIKQVLEDPSGAIFACLVMVSLGCVIVMVSSFYNLYTVIIDEKGCTKLLGRYRKRYMWDELEIRQICSPMGQYTEGILFATKRKFPNVKNPRWYYRLHPFSSFVVNFKGKRMAMGKNPGTQHIDRCSVDKKLLLARFAEWGIELEDTRFRK